MIRFSCSLLVAYAVGCLLSASPDESQVVFRSDVSLVRVDAQVIDSANRAISDLRVEDFVLREGGHIQPIRSFATEDMPLDVLLLLDVSASMGPHVQRIADASRQALLVLGPSDRMGIMVFDRSTRMRLPFSRSRQELQRGLDHLLRQERFNGGTDITRGMLDAAGYLQREGRCEARRAIVILTDDQTEFDRDDAKVSLALAGADTVMCALIAPDAMQFGRLSAGVGLRPGVFGNPVLNMSGFTTHRSAGTAQIARNSGGDAISVDQASALEQTLLRLRQRYTLYFSLPDDVRPGQEGNIEVGLADTARHRFPDAEVRYRRVYMTPTDGAEATPMSIVEKPDDRGGNASSSSPADTEAGLHRAPSSETRDSSALPSLSHVGQPSAQPSKPSGASWLMRNYRFTGPPSAGELRARATDPIILELQQIQNTVLAILRKTDFAKDYEAALAASAQATVNAQLIGSLTERQHSQETGRVAAAEMQSPPPIYLIALKDKTIDAATSYWVEGLVLNYITLQGAHVIVRLDLVDGSFSIELNHQRGLEFRIPDTTR
jgi:VWFA-related protein